MDRYTKSETALQTIVISGLIAALYALLTIFFAPLSYGPLQFRVSTLLVPVCLLNKRYGFGIALGVALGNIMSPFGFWDWFVMPILCLGIYQVAFVMKKSPLISIGWIGIATSISVAIFPLGIGLGLPISITIIPLLISILPILYAGWFVIWRNRVFL